MTKPTPKTGGAGDAPEPKGPETDPRHPDTTADKGTQPPALNPEDYGFRAIEVRETVDETGPGTIEPTRVESVSAGETFADRAKSRGGNKAVQSAENK